MHPQLEILLQIQDLKAQKRELLDADAVRQVEEEQFNVDIDAAVEQLDAKIAEMKDALEPGVRSRFERIAQGRGRPVVPVVKGTCYGCFTSVATARATGGRLNQTLQACENCGRFLYVVD